MKNNITLILIAALLVLFTFALLEKAKWAKNKSTTKNMTVPAQSLSSLPPDDRNSNSSTTPISAMMPISDYSVKAPEKIDSHTTEILINFDIKVSEIKLNSIKSELGSHLTESRQFNIDRKDKTKKYLIRFISEKSENLIPTDDQYKLIGQINQEQSEKWTLTYTLENASKPSRVKTFLISEKILFPRPNPMQAYKMEYNDSIIASQMATTLIIKIKKYFEIELSKKGTIKLFK